MKISKNINNEINRVIRNYNQKVSRLEREGKYLVPNKITKASFKSFNSTRDIKRRLNQLKRFSRLGAEEVITTKSGLDITRYEKRELQILQRTAKAKITREIKKLESSSPSIAGKMVEFTFAQMGDDSYLNLKAKRDLLDSKNIENLTRDELRRLKKTTESILKERRSDQFQGSYIDMLSDIAYMSGYDKNKLSNIKDNIDEMSNKDFIKLFKKDKLIQSLIFYYAKKGTDNRLVLENEDEVNEILDSMYDYFNS